MRLKCLHMFCFPFKNVLCSLLIHHSTMADLSFIGKTSVNLGMFRSALVRCLQFMNDREYVAKYNLTLSYAFYRELLFTAPAALIVLKIYGTSRTM